MYTTISKWDFVKAFQSSDSYKENFSTDGLIALFEYLEGYEEDTNSPIELDRVALCCEYAEIDIDDIEKETGCESLEDLQYNTQVIEVPNTNHIIYQSF